MCVECLFLRHRGPVPYGTNQRAPKWRPTRTPPVIPVPESLAAQTALCKALLSGSGSGPKCFQALGSPPGLPQSPMLGKGGARWPQGESRVVSPVPPGPGWTKQRTEIPRPSSPAGTAAAECPEEAEPPAWEAPAAQISQRAPSPQGRGRLTMRHKAAKQARLQPGNGEGRRGG